MGHDSCIGYIFCLNNTFLLQIQDSNEAQNLKFVEF